MKRIVLILTVAGLSLLAQAKEPTPAFSKVPDILFWGFAEAPEGALKIERAAAPLFRDPVFDGAADPSVVYEESDRMPTGLPLYTYAVETED